MAEPTIEEMLEWLRKVQDTVCPAYGGEYDVAVCEAIRAILEDYKQLPALVAEIDQLKSMWQANAFKGRCKPMWWWLITISAVILAFLTGFAMGAATVSAIDDEFMHHLGIRLPGDPPALKGTPPCNPEYESEL